MLSLRAHAIICASLFAALLTIGWGGSILQATGVIHDPGIFRIPLLILMLALTVAFALSAIPVMVMLVLGFQSKIGNENVPAVAAALRARKTIIWTLWALMLAGIAIGLPAAIKGGLFDPPAAAQRQ